jgi:pimeloyl-ACP methyl ester carboxylesterase
MKTAVVLVGRHEVTKDRYEPVVKALQDNGWENVIFYEPDWQINSVERLVSDFIASLPEGKEPLTLLGFSLGAMIALIGASRITVENLILCSPSGYFAEYDVTLTEDDRAWANENLKDFRNFSATSVINKTKVRRGIIIAGQTELEQWPDFKQWINDLKSQTNWKYIELPETGHEIEAPAYQETIKKIIHTIAR